jgi:hypothetical protein
MIGSAYRSLSMREDVLRRSRTVLDLLVARPYPFSHTGLARFDRRPLA